MSSPSYSSAYQGNRGRKQSTASSATDEGLQILSAFYTRTYPSADELAISLDQFSEGELDEVVTELRNEVAALREETEAMQHQVDALRGAAAAAGSGTKQAGKSNMFASSIGLGHGSDDGTESGGAQTPSKAMSSSTSHVTVSASALGGGSGAAAGGTRRGQRYRRKSATMGDLVQYVRVEDKMKLLEMEMDRVRERAAQEGRENEQVTAALVATAEEANRRMKELRLEVMQLHREVLDPQTGEATADELVRYWHRREVAQNSYLDKIRTQCQSTESDICRAQAQARQRRAAGEAFQPIDFDQLRIENQQFIERLDKKNAELAALKAMSTRTVQYLNALTDALNAITAEQVRLKRESKSRSEYLVRCRQDVRTAVKEAAQAEKKNVTIKAQQEAVKVPKIEEYIAQKAELYELEKALGNWKRKVEIAEGQVAVVRQQTRALKHQQKQAEEYAQNRLHRARGAAAGAAASATAGSCRRAGGGGIGVKGRRQAGPSSAGSNVLLSAHGGAVQPQARSASQGRGNLVETSKSLLSPVGGGVSAGSSLVESAGPHYIAHTPNVGEAAATAAEAASTGAPQPVRETATPLVGQSNSSIGLSSQVLAGGAGKAVLEAKRAATPMVSDPQDAEDARDGEQADVVTE